MTEQITAEEKIKARVFDLIVEAERHQLEINKIIEAKNQLLKELEKVKEEK